MQRWATAAILASLSWTGTVSAQMPPLPPGQGAPPAMPVFAGEPTPMPTGQFVAPGPGKQADNPFALPNDGSPNAFNEDVPNGSQQSGCFFNIGAMAFLRNTLGSGIVAVADPQTADTGVLPPPGQPVLARFNSVPTGFPLGVKAAFGFREAGCAVELAGFYLPWQSRSHAVTSAGQIDLLFGAFAAPNGFQGSNGLWNQADAVSLQYQSELANAELNYRCGDGCQFEWLIGVRGLQIRERYGILTADALGVPDQTALYQVQTRNRLLLGQVGFEWENLVLSRLAVGISGKGGVGVNLAEINRGLVRGDGLVGANVPLSRTGLASAWEVGLFADVLITDQWRLRVGYQALWAVNIAEATQNVNFNLNDQFSNPNYSGNAFYHGPAVEFQFVF